MRGDSSHERALQKIEADYLGADLQLSLFFSALESYRHDSILRPFPPSHLKEGGDKAFTELIQLCKTFPCLKSMVKGRHALSQDGWELLDWILSKSFSLTTLNKSKFVEIERRTGQASYSSTQPDFVFEVTYNRSSTLSARFDELSQTYTTLYAYHGSRLDNFHSILHNGLHAHLNKNSLFGEGTYLSSDLNVCMPYSKFGQGWQKSATGEKLSCIAVCEVLDHPDVKCTVERSSTDRHTRNRARARNSEGGDVPERYYVVTNNELVRVKYVLVYTEKKSTRVQHQDWLVLRHPIASMLVLYVLCLVLIGLSRTRPFQKMFGADS